jgi:putative NADPH-quinone reductase
VDRVVKNGIAFTFHEEKDGSKKRVKLVKLKKAVVINTANSSEEREASLQFPLQNLWQSSVFKFLKVNDFNRKTFRIISDSTHEVRTNWLNETYEYIKELFPSD